MTPKKSPQLTTFREKLRKIISTWWKDEAGTAKLVDRICELIEKEVIGENENTEYVMLHQNERIFRRIRNELRAQQREKLK